MEWDAEIVLTTSFHGTAFSINYGTPVFSIVKDKSSNDNRQINLLRMLGLDNNILSIQESVPSYQNAKYEDSIVQEKLQDLREDSIHYLINAIKQ